MKNKNITLILIIVMGIALVVFISTKVFNNENSVQETLPLNENEQEVDVVPEHNLDPRVERSLEIRSSSTNTASGSLSQVGDDYFSLELKMLKDPDFDFSSGEEPEFNYEYIMLRFLKIQK
jgi:ABC-type antimicrobial peptide transport system permease subunit